MQVESTVDEVKYHIPDSIYTTLVIRDDAIILIGKNSLYPNLIVGNREYFAGVVLEQFVSFQTSAEQEVIPDEPANSDYKMEEYLDWAKDNNLVSKYYYKMPENTCGILALFVDFGEIRLIHESGYSIEVLEVGPAINAGIYSINRFVDDDDVVFHNELIDCIPLS